MKPTIGRIVHFYTRDTTRHANSQGEGPYAAIVTQVFTDTMCNLKVMPPFVPAWDAGSVSRETDPVALTSAQQFWDWPPRNDGKPVS